MVNDSNHNNIIYNTTKFHLKCNIAELEFKFTHNIQVTLITYYVIYNEFAKEIFSVNIL